MADTEDKDYADRVAAGRKRYEQLKKQKAKKAQADKKDHKDKAESEEGTISRDIAGSDEATTEYPADDKADGSVKDSTEQPVQSDSPVTQAVTVDSETPSGAEASVEWQDKTGTESSSEQSRIRSESFKRGVSQTSATAAGLKLGPISPGGDGITDIYKKQASRIEQLEKDNKRLEKEFQEQERVLHKVEGEVEELREAQADTVDLRLKAANAKDTEEEVTTLKAEISLLQRQNSVLQSQVKDKRRQSSTVTPFVPDDLSAQLTAKINTIESLELEISNVRHSLSTTEFEKASLKTRISSLESSLVAAETFVTTTQQELATLRGPSSTNASDVNHIDSSTSSSSTSADVTRMHLLTSDLAVAQHAATDATVRAATLEKKIETLTTLHRESEARSATQATGRAKELERLRSECAEMRLKLSNQSSQNSRLRAHSISSSYIESNLTTIVNPGSTDPDILQARVRELEAELHDLRSGAWREKRMELQGDGMEEDEGTPVGGVRSPAKSIYDDVDLTAPTTPMFGRTRSSPYGALTNVLNAFSEVAGTATAAGSAFLASQQQAVTGGSSGGTRKQSLRQQSLVGGFFGVGGNNEHDGLQEGEEDEFSFDEDAFRAAQEEEGRKRLERVREVKRGLKEWEGWRVDLVELRGGEAAGVFDV